MMDVDDDFPEEWSSSDEPLNGDYLEEEIWNDTSLEDYHFVTQGKLFVRNVGATSFRVLIFQGAERLAIRGCVDARAVFGTASCFGYQLTGAYQPIYSPDGYGYFSLETGPSASSSTPFSDWARSYIESSDDNQTQEDHQLKLVAFVKALAASGDETVANTITAIVVLRPSASLSYFRPLHSVLLKSVKQEASQDGSLVMATAVLIGSPQPRDLVLSIAPAWRELTSSWTSTLYPSVILVCGKKNVGKSTLVRYLSNVLASKVGKVALMDLDLGQPELTAPGMISLNVLEGGLTGPSFTSIYNPNKRLVEAQSAGVVSAQEELDWITSVALQFFARFMHSSDPGFLTPLGAKIPLVVNTHGWVESTGYQTLVELVAQIRPNVLVQIVDDEDPLLFYDPAATVDHSNAAEPINSSQQQSQAPPTQTAAATKKGHPTNPDATLVTLTPVLHHTDYSTIRSTEKRILQLTSALSCGLHHNIYSLPWSAFRIFIESDVSPSQAMVVLNASMVSLVVDKTSYFTIEQASSTHKRSDKASLQDDFHLDSAHHDFADSNAPRHSMPKDLGLPQFLLSRPLAVSSYCVGVALITSIDMTKRLFYLSTSVSSEDLRAVNTLVKGQIELPPTLLMQGAIPGSPYLTGDVIGAESGSANFANTSHVKRR